MKMKIVKTGNTLSTDEGDMSRVEIIKKAEKEKKEKKARVEAEAISTYDRNSKENLDKDFGR